MANFLDRVKARSATTGSGTLTLGSAVTGFKTWDIAIDGGTYGYLIEDDNGSWEIGYGVYTASGTTLARTVKYSSNANSAINCSGGVNVSQVPLMEDFQAITGHGDSIYTILPTDTFVYTNAALTAARAWTLPSAALYPVKQSLTICDLANTLTSSNKITLTRAGSDTINGGTTLDLILARERITLYSDGVSKWMTRPATGVTAGQYGSAANVGQFTVDQWGRISQAANVAINPAGLVFLAATGALSGVASSSFTSLIDSTYKAYLFIFENWVPATNNQPPIATVSSDGGSTYKSTGYVDISASGGTFIVLAAYDGVNTANKGLSGTLFWSNPSASGTTHILGWLSAFYRNGSSIVAAIGGGQWDGTGALNAIKFASNSGNFSASNIYMLGVKGS